MTSSVPQSVRDYFRNLGREYGRWLAVQERQKEAKAKAAQSLRA